MNVAGVEFVPYMPDHFDVVDHETFERVYAELVAPGVAAREAAKKAAVADAAEYSTTTVQTPARERAPRDARTPEDSAEWKDWRARALAALPLEAVYGDLLVGGASADGWLKAIDPAWKPTSKNARDSAGVADGTGEAERGSFHSFRSGATVSVFDFLMDRQGITWIAAARDVAKLSGVPTPPPSSSSARGASGPGPGVNPDHATEGPAAPAPGPGWSTSIPRSQRPIINIHNRQLDAIVEDTWTALQQANARDAERPRLFLRQRALVRLVPDDLGPVIECLAERDVIDLISRVATWVKVANDMTINALPLREAARGVLSAPAESLPRLDAVVATPVFDAEGRLIDRPGYHPTARLWLHQVEGFTLPPIPAAPSDEEVAAAKTMLLDQLLVDFPFVSQADRCHALAALLLPFVRRMIPGPAPLHLLEAPTPGSGKGLLAEVISLVAVGRPCDVTTLGRNDEETRKNLTSVLLKGSPINLIDNISDIMSGTLAGALTATTWSDRLLSTNQMVDLPNRCLWLATANNPALSDEIMRRCLRVRIDTRTDRPWLRHEFKHPNLPQWVRDERSAIVRAALVLVQRWIAAGRPQGTKPLGSFLEWANVMGGIMASIEVPGFMDNSDDLYANAGSESSEWREFVEGWREEFGRNAVVCRELREFAIKRDLLLSVLGGGKTEKAQQCSLGKALAKQRDRQFGELRLEFMINKKTKAKIYRVVRDEEAGSEWGEPAAGGHGGGHGEDDGAVEDDTYASGWTDRGVH